MYRLLDMFMLMLVMQSLRLACPMESSSVHYHTHCHRLTAMLCVKLNTKDILDLFSTAVARQWNKATCTLHQTMTILS